MAWKVYEIAREFNCSEQALIDFLCRNGILCNNRYDLVSERGYNLARQNRNSFSKTRGVEIFTPTAKPDELSQVKSRLDNVQSAVTEMSSLKSRLYDIPSIKTELSRVKSRLDDVQSIKTELSQIKSQLSEIQTVKNTPAHADFGQFLAKLDTITIDKSPIKYFGAVLSLTDELLKVLQDYEAAQAETIAEFLKISLKLSAKYTDNPNLTAEENSLLAERQKFLATRLELGIDAPKRRILSVKAQAERFFERLDKISDGDNLICELAALQAEPRADFDLLTESLARIITDAQHKADFFAEHKNLVVSVVNAQSAWSDSYKAFKTSLRAELSAICHDDSIEDEFFAAWYDDWQKKRFAIEQRLLPLVEFALKGNLLDSFDGVLKILQDYRDEVAKFYLNERKNIYQKFAFQDGGDLQEKFETESELYKLAEKFQRDLQKIIFARDKTEERIFLLRWAEPILNISIDEISDFIRDKELDAISEEVLTQFAELRRQNFAAYIADSKSYGDAAQKREKEFNALIFRMRKDLRKK